MWLQRYVRQTSPDFLTACLAQILKNIPHDQRADLWSIGVVTYVLLVGYPPFMDDDQSELFSKIRNGEYSLSNADWDPISQPAKDMIKGLLTINQKERWTIQQCLDCEWLAHDAKELAETALDSSKKSMKEKKERFSLRSIMWFGNKTSEKVVNRAPIVVPDDAPESEHMLV